MAQQGPAAPGGERFKESHVVDLAAEPPGPDSGSEAAPIAVITDSSFPQLVEQSKQVPVVIDLWATWCEPCKQLTPVLERLAAEYKGRFLLAKIDVDASPQVAQAFGVQSVPMVAALIGGQAVPLFVGVQRADQIRTLLDEVLKVAASQGVTGTVAVRSADDGPPQPPPLPPLHQKGVDAIEAGDLAGAADAYRQALAQNPSDQDAKAALESVELMRRVDGVDFDAVFAAATTDPGSVDKALAAADVEVASSAPQAAFDRLLPLVRVNRGDERERLRARLVEYFDIVGADDPAVAVARRSLAAALY
ncbi:MAG: tetratricopeptide repeat protein [Bifidobacteriaceae bacterium]|jgi:putative thioredoxin|nr:tetratricopeptide repeat protein [Bifidobacteriaceae bacterium]